MEQLTRRGCWPPPGTRCHPHGRRHCPLLAQNFSQALQRCPHLHHQQSKEELALHACLGVQHEELSGQHTPFHAYPSSAAIFCTNSFRTVHLLQVRLSCLAMQAVSQALWVAAVPPVWPT